jgi:hypothetical protein
VTTPHLEKRVVIVYWGVQKHHLLVEVMVWRRGESGGPIVEGVRVSEEDIRG